MSSSLLYLLSITHGVLQWCPMCGMVASFECGGSVIVFELTSCDSPLAGGTSSGYTDTSDIYDDPVLKSLAEKYSISAGTVILSWLVQRGIVVIPHSSSPTRLAQNRQLALLEEEDMQQLNSFHERVGRKLIIESAPVGWVEVPGKGRCFMGWNVPEIGWRDEEGNCLT